MRLLARIAMAGGSARIDEVGKLRVAAPDELKAEIRDQKTELLREIQALNRGGEDGKVLLHCFVLLAKLTAKGMKGGAMDDAQVALDHLYNGLAHSKEAFTKAKRNHSLKLQNATLHIWVMQSFPGQLFDEVALTGSQLYECARLQFAGQARETVFVAAPASDRPRLSAEAFG